MNWKEVAILCRTKVDFERFEAALTINKIPYQVVGGPSFFDCREVKDVMALLSWILNLNAHHHISRFCKNMTAGLGESAFDAVYDQTPGPISFSALQNTLQGMKTSKKQQLLLAFVNAVSSSLCSTAVDTLRALDKNLGIHAVLKAQGEDRHQSFERLVLMAQDMNCNLQYFVDQVALLGSADTEESDNKLTLSTIHAAKGREWDVVIVPALYQGRLPHYRAETADDIAQELNAYYVAKTRARHTLIMTRPCSVKDYRGTDKPTTPSQFVLNNLRQLKALGTVRLHNDRSKESSQAE